jgi:hypothetical protein
MLSVGWAQACTTLLLLRVFCNVVERRRENLSEIYDPRRKIDLADLARRQQIKAFHSATVHQLQSIGFRKRVDLGSELLLAEEGA